MDKHNNIIVASLQTATPIFLILQRFVRSNFDRMRVEDSDWDDSNSALTYYEASRLVLKIQSEICDRSAAFPVKSINTPSNLGILIIPSFSLGPSSHTVTTLMAQWIYKMPKAG